MNLNINLSQFDPNIIIPFIGIQCPSNGLSTLQLHNLSTYLETLRRYKNPKTVINNHDNVLQAVNYDSDETTNYWIIIDKNFHFIDIAVPLYRHEELDLSNIELYGNIPEFEVAIIMSIKDFLN